MTQQLSPWIEGVYGWDFGEGGWNSGMDSNLLKFSYMFDKNVDSVVSALPPAVNGQAHYLTTDNRLYFAVGTTYFSTPVPKWFVIVVRSTGQTYQFNGTSLIQIDTVTQLDLRLDAVEVTISTLAVPNINALRNLPAPSSPTHSFFVFEHTSGTKLGGGTFYWDSSSTADDNNGTIIKPSSVLTTNPGRFIREGSYGEVNARWFGGLGTGNPLNEAADTAAILAAVATGRSVYIPGGMGNWYFSPLAEAIVFPPPFVNEGNRTSACILSSGQTVRGDGKSTNLVWGPSKSPVGNLPQCFFKVNNATNIRIKDLSFESAFAALVIDPITDGSVEGVTVSNCYFNSNLIDVIGGRQPPIDANSKFSKNIVVEFCTSVSPSNHSILFTNTYGVKAIGNSFKNVSNGFCVDASQGSHNVIISNNTAESVQYFAKVESSDPEAVNPSLFVSNEVIISNNQVKNISVSGIFLNSNADKVVISDNNLSGFNTYGIVFGQITAYANNGSVSTIGNVLTGNAGSTGIRDELTAGDGPHTFTSNVISGVSHGIWLKRKNACITGGSVRASDNGIVLDTTVSLDGVTITGGIQIISGGVGVNLNGSLAAKNINISDAIISYGSGGIYDATSAVTRLIIKGVTLNSASPLLPAIVLTNPTACLITNNILNANTASLSSIQTQTSTTDCIISNNISNRPFSIASPNPNTINTGNITTATYSA